MMDQNSSADDLYRALARQHRRQVLFSLLERERLEMSEGEFDRDALWLQMMHSHLPILDEMNFVEWQQDRGLVSRGSDFHKVEPVLKTLRQHHDTSLRF